MGRAPVPRRELVGKYFGTDTIYGTRKIAVSYSGITSLNRPQGFTSEKREWIVIKNKKDYNQSTLDRLLLLKDWKRFQPR